MLRVDGLYFKDEDGRTVMLRGVNLGGSSKFPAKPDGATQYKERFYDYKAVTFVGRPFPAPEADEHFARLRHWGFNCLRFLVTWEAIEHVGPGEYDLVYLDYLTKMVAKAGEYGFFVFIDPHQDVWSRWTGGDGAPAWTLEAVGFDLRRLHESGAAFLHQEIAGDFPIMQWVTNYGKLAAATMFTLFFGGHDFAPHTKVNGEAVQAFLQRHYFGALKQVAARLAGMAHVIGYDTLNEPSLGWIGREDLQTRHGIFNKGAAPTPFQAMLLGAGIPQTVPVVEMGLTGERVLYEETLNPNGVRAWRHGFEGVWEANGVWEPRNGGGRLLRPRHFAELNGRRVDAVGDYYRPFIVRFVEEIRAVDPAALIFVEPPLDGELPELDLPGLVNATHWYDPLTLFTRHYIPHLTVNTRTRTPIVGAASVARSFAWQLAQIKATGEAKLGGPTLLGEFGIAFDLDEKGAYESADFSNQIAAMDRTWRALEANLLSGTLWNYTADNTNAHGDGWNGEDLSIFSRDQIGELDDPHDLDAGGRAVGAFVRPYPRRVAGEPLSLSFDMRTREFEFVFTHDPTVSAPTEIFVPSYHYSVGLGVEVSDGEAAYDAEAQTLTYHHNKAYGKHTIRLFREHGPAEVLSRHIETAEGNYPIEHHFVQANGITLHTVQAGAAQGDPVMLLHGFPEFWYGWKYQIPYLVRQGYRVIVPDQRGYNLSDKPRHVADYKLATLVADVVGLIDALGYERVHLIGHDWGAMVTWWVAGCFPERVNKAVVLNVPHPAAFAENLGNPRQLAKSWYAAAFQIPLLPEAIGQATDWKLGETLLRASGHPDTFTAEDITQYRRAWARPGAMGRMLNWYRSTLRYPIDYKALRVTRPLLLIWGAQDVALGREMARPSVADYCEDGRLVFIEEATHWVQHDEPERVNALIGRFLRLDSKPINAE